MTHEPKTFTVADPRSFDGDPFEVAERACKQPEAVARILSHVAETANLMARNAQMERNLLDGDDAKASDWDESIHGKRFAAACEKARQLEKEFRLLGQAAGFNPKKAR